jgi:hypothetical protein
VEENLVCPYLFRLREADLKGPLAQFQAVAADRDGTLKLVKTMNTAQTGRRLSEEQVKVVFDGLWPTLQASLEKVPSAEGGKPTKRPDRELLEEILQTVRALPDALRPREKQSNAVYANLLARSIVRNLRRDRQREDDSINKFLVEDAWTTDLKEALHQAKVALPAKKPEES